MIVKLSPEQIVEAWDNLRPLVLDNLIPKVDRNEETVFRVIENLMSGGIILWAGIEEGDKPLNERIYGFIATIIEIDAISKTKSLILYSLFATKRIKLEDWENGLKALDEFKDVNGCSKMIAYSDNPSVISLAQKLGFRVTSFLIKE